MYSGKFTAGQTSAVRKSRVEGKQSLLPKPRRPGSTDRVSVEARRPSAVQRSSSAEPARATIGGRLSRETSATKIPLNWRSRSQQGALVTPLRSNHYSRGTTTPVRTPSEDRTSRGWQHSVERALAFVTIKDQRPISNVAWQRAEVSRVGEALALRGEVGGGLALIRPLTIARFVDITGRLLSSIVGNGETKLNTDNYVAKLPNLVKRFLYPGAVSKSWLKTVNTLHAFPHALALISYFLDLVNHIEKLISDEWLYLEKDEVACLRRDYLHKCWNRFQEPDAGFDDLNQEYLQRLKHLLGDVEHHIAQLNETIQQCEDTLADKGEMAARAEEEHIRSHRDALLTSLRAMRAERSDMRAESEAQRARARDEASAARGLDADIISVTAEIQELKQSLEQQNMTVSERARLLDEVDYATRVIDSKRTLADQLAKMLSSKEAELAGWQKRTLDSCVEYKQALINLAATFPQLAALAVDEKELMEAECAEAVSVAVDTLRGHAASLADRRCELARARAARGRHVTQLLEEARAKITELKCAIERTQQAVDAEAAKEGSESAQCSAARNALQSRLDELNASEEHYSKVHNELDFWEKQEFAWRTRLTDMRQYTECLRASLTRELEVFKRQKADVVKSVVRDWHRALDAVEAQERGE